TPDGNKRSLGMLSGGQFRRVALALDLSLADMIATRNSNPINLIICDEYFKDLSLESMEKIRHLLEQREGSIVLIEHSHLFKATISNRCDIAFENGTSRGNDT